MKIDYIEIADYFCSIINGISEVQSKITCWKWSEEPEPTVDLLNKAKNDNSNCYWSFERAFNRAKNVKRLIEFENEPDFASFALDNLRNTQSRIEHFLKDSELEYPDYDLHKYDYILKDYYEKMYYYDNATMKYTHIEYLRTNINLGICHDIDHCYELLSSDHLSDVQDREKNFQILDEIVKLVKQLYGFKAPADRKNNYINYNRWNCNK